MLDCLQYIADSGDSSVRIFCMTTRRVDERGAVQAANGLLQRRGAVVKIVSDRGLAHEARSVRHQFPQGNWLIERIMRCKVGDILGDWRIEIDLAPFHQLHNSDVGKQFGYEPTR